jgi:predicted nicotinamide N-methyase
MHQVRKTVIGMETKTKTKTKIKETKWYDAWIRWEIGSKESYNVDNDDEEEDEHPVPTDTFSFEYGDSISIQLEGFPAESEAVWSSTGLTLWRSSEYLCYYLMENKEILMGGKRILEVGSGLGRSGILASLLVQQDCEETSQIYLTDGDTDTLAQLRANVQRNCDPAKSNTDNISCRQLLWGEDTAKALLERQGGNEFDVIMGSDLVYVPKVIKPLMETLRVLLKKGGIFVMAHCVRRQGNEVRTKMVLEAADQIGLCHQLLKRDDDVYLYEFKWKEA